jgi:hypothetical protein
LYSVAYQILQPFCKMGSSEPELQGNWRRAETKKHTPTYKEGKERGRWLWESLRDQAWWEESIAGVADSSGEPSPNQDTVPST